MIDLKQQEIWFVTGSQHLYGPKTLQQVAVNSKEIATAIGASAAMPATVVFKGVMKTPDEITDLCQAASADRKCVGLIFWCHTFSPAKMWIRGFGLLTKPFVHLHTQYGRDIPWGDFENAFPAFLTIVGIPLTYSISYGIGLGFICYCLIKVFHGID